MQAIQISEPGQIQLVDHSDPRLTPDSVLLRVNRIGYCGSDLAAFRGLNPLVTYPRIPGHEIGATIVETGSDVDPTWRVGQHVLVVPYANCGKCAGCLAHRPNCCKENITLGVQGDGALCEYFVAPADKLLSSPALSLTEMALVEPLSVGSHAVARGAVTSQDTVAVFGCGAIGLGAIAGARYQGARVIAIDIDDRKLEKGKACGAIAAINSRTGDLHSQLLEMTDGHGPNVMIEAVGLAACYRAAVEEVAAAGRVVYIGWSKEIVQYDVTPFIYKELDIRGSRNATVVDFSRVIAMLEARLFPIEEVITMTVPLTDAADAMREWDRDPGRITKIHIELD